MTDNTTDRLNTVIAISSSCIGCSED